MEDIRITETVTIPESSIQFRFSRSSGKGGQNVNKVSTKVEALLNLNSIIADDKSMGLLMVNLGRRLDSGGMLRVVSQESRSQWKNRNIAVEKLTALIADALIEEKERFATKPTRSSRRVRVEKKKKHGVQKSQRRKRFSADD